MKPMHWSDCSHLLPSETGNVLWGKTPESTSSWEGIVTIEHLQDLALDSLPPWAFTKLTNRILLIQSADYAQQCVKALRALSSQELKNNVLLLDASLRDLPSAAQWLKALTEEFQASFCGAFFAPHLSLLKCQLSQVVFEKMSTQWQWFLDGRQTGTAHVHPTAQIAQNVFIGEHTEIGAQVQIMPGAVIGPRVVIDEGSVIFPHVSLYPLTKVGKHCRLHSGVVVGSDGFGYEFNGQSHQKIWHVGGVVIGDHVEIGSNSCVDGGTFYPTIVATGSKIDNQVQIAHNTRVGEHAIMCGQAGTAGSSRIGRYTVMGGKAALGPQCELGDQCQIAGNAMVTKSWPAKSILGGHPARPLEEWMRGVAYLKKMLSKSKPN